MKKAISLLLCVVLIASSCGIVSAAAKKDDTPLVFVPGFLQPDMYIEDGGEREYLWPPMAKNIVNRMKDDMPNFILSIFGLLLGDVEGFGYTLGTGAYAVAEKMRCNPDGSSVYPVQHYSNAPEQANAEAQIKLYENYEIKTLLFKDYLEYIQQNNLADLKNVFVFNYDSRFDSITLAEELDSFINDVKEYTGSKKVNVLGLSYGGLIVATYLYYHMDEKAVDKAVLSVPALGGTNFGEKLFRQEADLPLDDLIDFVESVLGTGTEISTALESKDGDFLNRVLNSASGGMLDVVKYWGSVWSLSTPEIYESLKKDFLDPVANKEIIKANDIIHNEIMPSMRETFERCRSLGTEVSIVAGCGSTLCLGGDDNGDILLPTNAVTGAKCAKLGERFADGYTQVGTVCNNSAHNHVSPSMEIDASCAFLPENTWFIDKQYHAMFSSEEYATSLISKLLFTDELSDVHSDPNYPQFEYSNNPHRGVRAKFNNSLSGYIASGDTALLVENLFPKAAVKVVSVIADGIELDFSAGQSEIINPGESVAIPFKGEIPKVSATNVEITVNYVKIGVPGLVTSVVYDFMIDNGEPPAYGGGCVKADNESMLQKFLPDIVYNILAKTALRRDAECVFDTFMKLVGAA